MITGPTGFVKASAGIYFVETWVTLIRPLCVSSWMKWWQVSMCFDLWFTNASLHRNTAPWFSFDSGRRISTLMGGCWKICLINRHNHRPCLAQSPIARYSAFVVESVTDFCRQLFHNTRDLCTNNTNPVVDRWVSTSPASLASVYPLTNRFCTLSSQNVRVRNFVLFVHQSKCLTAAQCVPLCRKLNIPRWLTSQAISGQVCTERKFSIPTAAWYGLIWAESSAGGDDSLMFLGRSVLTPLQSKRPNRSTIASM